MAIPSLYLAHEFERRLYMALAMHLCFDPRLALKILAFWLYLERLGFRNPVKAIIFLPSDQIKLIADEAITCLSYLRTRRFLSSSEVSDLPLTKSIISEVISLQFLVEKRSDVNKGIREVTREVCNPALMDLVQEAEKRKASLIGGDGLLTLPWVHPDDRALFVTFSRGFPVAKKELRDFFTKYYKVSVESVHMQVVKRGQQSLYARVVFRSPDIIEEILSGEEKVKFTINRKHAWMRKFVPKD